MSNVGWWSNETAIGEIALLIIMKYMMAQLFSIRQSNYEYAASGTYYNCSLLKYLISLTAV